MFYADSVHQMRWKQFLQNIENEEKNIELSKVISEIKEFLEPIVITLINSKTFDKTWSYVRKWH
jgi:hypothetical protein